MKKRTIWTLMGLVAVALLVGVSQGIAGPGGGTYYANSDNLTKFVDTLPGVGPLATNDLGQYIPVAARADWVDPNGVVHTDQDYYEIGIVEYTEQMHKELPKATRLRGYVQIEPPGAATPLGSLHVALTYPNGSPILVTNAGVAYQVYGYDKPHYLGPTIVATQNRPVRIKYYNLLPLGTAGNLFIPVDTTYMGAGTGPNGTAELYTENRAELHLHGGLTPWISDGTPHQWITPAGETTSYPEGDSFQNVPDMQVPPLGSATLYYPNQQSARLMFYHDHAYGMTRLNVYAGEAAGYLLTDPTEAILISGGTIGTTTVPAVLPNLGIPLIIQDKTFVPANVAVQDALWDTTKWGLPGDLWFPHVYECNQDPNTADGTNPNGRWDYGPWFWPIFPVLNPVLPTPSGVPEAFVDTPVINGTAYPTTTVLPQTYRFRILNACNDRYVNLQLYVADPANGGVAPGVAGLTEVAMVPAVPNGSIPGQFFAPEWPTDGRDGGVPNPTNAGPDMIQIGTEGGFLAIPAVIPSTPVGYEYFRRSITVLNVSTHGLFMGPAERADVLVDFSGFAGKTLILYSDAPAPVPAFDARIDYYTGDVDQTANGGAPTTLVGKGPNTRTIMQIVVSAGAPVAHTFGVPLALGAMTVTSPGKLYTNAAPPTVILRGGGGSGAAANATVDPLLGTITAVTVTAAGGGYVTAPEVIFADTNAPSLGTGTGASATAALSAVPALATALAAAFNASQDPPIVPLPRFEAAFPPPASYGSAVWTNKYFHIYDGAANFPTYSFIDVNGVSNNLPILNKGIQELFEPIYGRMNSTMSAELPFTTALNQTTIPLAYVDPVTEIIPEGQTQIWKFTHNGVDTHAIHFHLVNVQVLNRVGWDGTIKPPNDNEIGWKETVRMHPLEDCIVALRGKKPMLPFGITNSVRLMDVTAPVGSTLAFTQINPFTGTPAVVQNAVADFGWEYVYHCHLLGHEEQDMMRPLKFVVGSVVPDAPTGLAETFPPPTPTSASFTWVDPTPATPANLGNPKNEIGFQVWRATVNPRNGRPGAYAVVGFAPANATVFTDPAASGSTYNYYVVAYNAAGSSVPSALIQIVAGGPPSAPLNLSGAVTGPTQVTLTFTDTSLNEFGFGILRSVNGGPSVQIATLGAQNGQGTVTYVDNATAVANTYVYGVYAFAGTTPQRNSPTNTVTVSTALLAPSGLTATIATASRVTLNWVDNAANNTATRVERSADGGATWTILTSTLGANATAYNDNTPVQGTTYTYRVTAVNVTGAVTTLSPPSATASVLFAAPVTPTGLTIGTITRIGTTANDSVTLSWTAVGNASTYTIIRYTSATATTGGTSTTGLTGTTTALTVPRGTPGVTRYWFRIQAVNPVATSAQSAAVGPVTTL